MNTRHHVAVTATPLRRDRRRWLGMALGAGMSLSSLLLVACGERAEFHGIDITGADYAKDFDLTDQNGQRRTLADFRGKVVVVFFGYTQCPDVCPTTMAELAEAKRLLGTDGERLQGVFVSVDPERDTPEVLRAYMDSFDPGFIALRPTPDELPGLARRFRIVYNKVEGPTPTAYTMDHSAGCYVYDTEGRLRLYHRYGAGASLLAEDVRRLLAEG
jgi:protein SCO1/2